MAGNEVVKRERTVPIVGDEVDVWRVLRAYRERGDLLSTEDELRRDHWRDGRHIGVRARVLVSEVIEPPVRRPDTVGKAIGKALAFVGGVFASIMFMIWLLSQLGGLLIDAMAGALPSAAGLTGIGTVLLILFWLARSATRGHLCRGVVLHCPACP